MYYLCEKQNLFESTPLYFTVYKMLINKKCNCLCCENGSLSGNI